MKSQKMDLPIDDVITGDAVFALKKYPDNFVDLIVTSPPYFRQRDY